MQAWYERLRGAGVRVLLWARADPVFAFAVFVIIVLGVVAYVLG